MTIHLIPNNDDIDSELINKEIIELTPEQYESIRERFIKKLQSNSEFWQLYWEIVDDAIRDEVNQK